MDKETLLIIADILNTIDRSNRDLYDMIDLLNVTPDEKERIVDSIMVVVEKLDQLRRSNIKDLDNYIDINHVRHVNRY